MTLEFLKYRLALIRLLVKDNHLATRRAFKYTDHLMTQGDRLTMNNEDWPLRVTSVRIGLA